MFNPQRTLIDSFLFSCKRNADKTAIIIAEQSYSYAEFYTAVANLSHALIEHGLQRGDRVAIYMNNSWPCVVSIYATLLAGGVFVLINPQTKSNKLNYMLNDCAAEILISENSLEKFYKMAIKNINLFKLLVVAGNSSKNKEQTVKNADSLSVDFNQLIKTSSPIEQTISPIIANDLAALIYTSGSTGFPKGVMQTHQSMLFSINSIIEYLRLDANESILLVLPLAFDYGLYQLLMTIHLGATLIIEKSFTFPVKIYQRLIASSASVFPAVPTIFSMMISDYKREPFSFPSVKKITNTAAALAADHIPLLHKIFPNALIFKMYGITECKRVSYLEPELVDKYPSSVGKAIPGTEIYLLSEQGKPVAENEAGILYVRGPHIMAGYWGQKQGSEKMLSAGKIAAEKVLCTHDLFRMDKNGLLYFISRSDDMIKTRGEKVSPVEVENILQQFEDIKEVAVLGVEDKLFGQVVLAFIVLEENAIENVRKIKLFCNQNMEAFMVPKEFIIKQNLPKSANGKIDKLLLKNEII